MAEKQINLNGIQALVVIVALVGVVIFRLATFDEQKNNTELVEELETLLIGEYFPDDVENLRAALESGDRAVSEKVAKSVASTKLNFHSVKTSFPLFNFDAQKKVIVKVTYSLEDDQGTRRQDTVYYRFRHSVIGDSWRYEGSSNAISYYLNFM